MDQGLITELVNSLDQGFSKLLLTKSLVDNHGMTVDEAKGYVEEAVDRSPEYMRKEDGTLAKYEDVALDLMLAGSPPKKEMLN